MEKGKKMFYVNSNGNRKNKSGQLFSIFLWIFKVCSCNNPRHEHHTTLIIGGTFKDAGRSTSHFLALCNATHEVKTTMYFSCRMCIGNVRLPWINKLNQTLSSLWSSSRRPSSAKWSLCCTIVSHPVGLSLWSTYHATFYQSLACMWMLTVLVLTF